jgi:hypothetical protein
VTAEEFLEQAGPVLLADEARHNLMLGVAANVRDLPHLFPGARFWAVDGAAALQTPPYNLAVARPRDADALAALAAVIDVELPGVTGAVPEVDDFAALWGRPTELTRVDNIWELRELRPPPRSRARRARRRTTTCRSCSSGSPGSTSTSDSYAARSSSGWAPPTAA